MPKRRVTTIPRINPDAPLELRSLGRRGPIAPLRPLSQADIARVERTVRRVPEVVVKVSGGGPDAASVKAHLRYIDRHGRLPIETDSGEPLPEKGAAQALVTDWNLDALPACPRRKPGLAHSAAQGGSRRPPKAVHNIVLSMPAKVPPEKVLAAVQVFARENFALMHRYAMVLHTDTRHPHVHLVVKAEREDGRGRLNIYKATLRDWREQFAQALRDQGIEANATSAVQRGRSGKPLKTAILRAARRSTGSAAGGSSFLQRKVGDVLHRMPFGDATGMDHGLEQLRNTREQVLAQWRDTELQLRSQGRSELADEVRAFAARMPAPRTDARRIIEAAARVGRASSPARGAEDGHSDGRAR